MLGLLGDPVRAKIAKEAASILKSASKVSGQAQAGPIRSRPGTPTGEERFTNLAAGDITHAPVGSPGRLFRTVEDVVEGVETLADLIV